MQLRKEYNCDVGYSGHEVGLAVSYAAAALEITSLERHITIDRSMYGSDQSASIEPAGFRQLVGGIRKIELAIGDGIKRISPSEKKNITIVRKSLVSKCLIKKGDAFTNDWTLFKKKFDVQFAYRCLCCYM